MDYKNRFPQNVNYIYQENQGQATARNKGMKLARGKYINFLDSDDKLELNALELVYNFFESHYEDVDVVSIPIKFFDRQRGNHILNYKYHSTQLIDLDEHPDYIQLSASASFIKKEAINDYIFDPYLVVSEDAIFINKILLEKRKIGVISKTCYYYRKRILSNSTVDLSVKNKDYYIQRSEIFFKELFNYSKSKYGEIYDFIKYTVVYDIQWIFLTGGIEKILGEDGLKKLKSILYELVQEIDDEIILKQRYHDKNLKYNILIFKHGGLETEIVEKNVKKLANGNVIDELYYHVLYIDAFEIHKNNVNILGYLRSYFKYPEIKIQAVKYDENEFIQYWLDYFNNRIPGFLEWEYLNDEGYEYKTNLLNNMDLNKPLNELKIDNFTTDIDLSDEDIILENIDSEYEFLKRDYIDEITYGNVKDEVLKKYLDNKGEVYESKKIEYPLRENKYLDLDNISYYNFEIDIPLDEYKDSNIKIRVAYGLQNFYLTVKMENYSKITEESFYSKKENYLIHFENNTFKLIKYSIPKLLELEKANIEFFESQKRPGFNEIINFRKHYYYSFMEYANRRIWLFMDRPDVADDNAEHLFKYALKQDDGIEKYFVLNKDSRDFKRLSEIGNVIETGSEEHKLLACHAEKIISSQADAVVINPFYKQEKFYNGLFSAKVYFLQHGVIKEDISSWLHRYDKYLYLILTSARAEYRSFFSPKSQYNYNKSIVQLLGLPRHDSREKLEDKKEIVVMPSWRRSLEHLSEEQFKNSEFFKAYNSLLNDEKLIGFLDKKGYTLIFKPHHNLYEHLHLFDRHPSVEFDDIESGDGKIHTYNDIFNHSSLLITDYSSAVFDFAYIKKPIIYYHALKDYHFDVENSFFDYETMGFGEIARSSEGLINLIMNYVNLDCEMKDKYKKRVDDFFEFRDKNNCKRVYEFILNDSADEKPQKLSNDDLNNLLISLGDDFYKNVDYEKRITKERLKKNELLEKLEAKNNEIKLKNNEIDSLNKELERKPIMIKVLNTRVDTARDLVFKLYNTTKEIINNAYFAENLIVYANRYRTISGEVNKTLTKAELMFYKGNYENCLKLVLDLVDKFEPGFKNKVMTECLK